MDNSDNHLLSDWRSASDATAFAELVSRHSPMVYGTCVRILGNACDAEEITQECFVELLKSNIPSHASLGGWLHAVATTRALNRLRSDGRRKSREARYAEGIPLTTEPTWDDVRAFVDEAIGARGNLELLRGQRQRTRTRVANDRTQFDAG